MGDESVGRDTRRLRKKMTIVMKGGYQRLKYLSALWLLFLLVAVVGKVAFLLYNGGAAALSVKDFMGVIASGLPLDLSTSLAIVLPVWVLVMLTGRCREVRVRRFALPYLLTVMFLVVLITVGDLVMYAHWKFKLDASIFGYMFCPGEVGSSVSTWYIVSRLLGFVVSLVLAVTVAIRITPKRIAGAQTGGESLSLLAFPVLGVLMLLFPGRFEESAAFRSDRILLNHAAINPVRHFASSAWLYAKPVRSQFYSMDASVCDSVMARIFPSSTEDITDTLLRTARPNILTLQLEGCGAHMIEALGGEKDVMPELCGWMKKGVNFSNAWATSFRTDRGTVSFVSGYVSYPTVSLMLRDSCLHKLPSLAMSLRREGYSAEYLYGGDPTVMNKKVYLNAMGFDPVLGIDDIGVAAEERDSWGANDSISMRRLLDIMLAKPKDESWYIGYQTISSHEPWQVPYSRLSDPIYNAFAYTDHCLGQFLDSLSRTPVWDNLLVVIFADHGVTYGLDMKNPEFFHMPLLFLGGALNGAKNLDVLVSQGDIAATVLSQMGIGHADFPWSRNVLSAEYTAPFVYCTYPSGVLYKDDSGTTMTDLMSGSVVSGDAQGQRRRLENIGVMLQATYSRMP